MTVSSLLEQNAQKLITSLQDSLNVELITILEAAAQTSSGALKSGKTIFWCGNGGSAAESQHMAAELMGRFLKERRPLSSISLNTDTSVLTCISNDYEFDYIFERQIQGLGKSGDLLVLFSTSGNSKNQVRAAKAAQAMGIITIGFVGQGGGNISEFLDFSIRVASTETARIQEIHTLLGHTFCQLIESEF